MINSVVGGSLMRETPEEAFELFEEVSLNAYQWQYDRLAKRIYETTILTPFMHY